jgi:hypothetical protein
MRISIINIVKNINPLINHKQEIENKKPKLQSEETRYKQENPKLNERKKELTQRDTEERKESSIGRFGNERNSTGGSALSKGLFGISFLIFADLLHLKHSLHNEFVFALFVRMAFVLALPWKIEFSLSAFVERDE